MFFYKFILVDDDYDIQDQEKILFSYEQHTLETLNGFIENIVAEHKGRVVESFQKRFDEWREVAALGSSMLQPGYLLSIEFMQFWEIIMKELVENYGFRELPIEVTVEKKGDDVIAIIGSKK